MSKFHYCLWIFFSIFFDYATGHIQKNEPKTLNNSDSSFFNGAIQAYKIYSQCSNKDINICLKIKLLTGLNNALQNVQDLKIVDGVRFISNENNPGIKLTNEIFESDIEASLPRSLEDKDSTLTSLIMEKFFHFLQSRTLQIKFPTAENFQRSLDEFTGRRKKQKGGGALLLIPLLLGGTLIPIAFGALALLAGKALIVSKLALVLASIIGIKKLLSSSGVKESQHEVFVSGGHGNSGWGREMNLAYSAYSPKYKIN